MKALYKDDIIELAHKRTVKYCYKHNIQLDVIDEDNEDVNYTDEAQDIFIGYLEQIEATYKELEYQAN